MDHGVGIIPGSLDTIAADMDAGDVRDLWAEVGMPIVWTETRRGAHSLEYRAMLAVMPAPRLPLSEVEAMAWDIATWVWSRPAAGPLVAGAVLPGGQAGEYGRVSHATVAALWERNRAIMEAVQGGRSRKAVARDLGLSAKAIQNVLAGAETWLSPDAKRETLAAIWGPHNPPSGGR